jgi:type I restriction enzyme, S subunit
MRRLDEHQQDKPTDRGPRLMDAQRFLAEFGHIASAPNGVQRLREMVLGLAFQGKIVENDHEGTETLWLSLARKKADFLTYSTNKKLIRDVELAQWKSSRIPGGWKWISLSSVGHNWGQKIPDASFTYIDVSAINNKQGIIGETAEILEAKDAPSRARKIVKAGTVIYSTVRPYLLNIAIIDKNFEPEPIASTAFAVIHPWEGILSRYLYHWLRSPEFVKYVEAFQTGTAYPAINDEIFFSGPFPLSTLAEQKRIVAKVDELMALCDKLEALQNQRKAARVVLTKEILGRVASNATVDAQAGLQNLSLLVSDVEQIPVLRQTILSLAVQGKLVEQDPGDEPAEKMIEEIRKIKALLFAKGKLKSDKAPDTRRESSVDHRIPQSWCWSNLQEIFEISRGGSPRPAGDPRFFGGRIPWITVGELTKDSSRYLTETSAGLTEEGSTRSRFINPGDLLLTNSGATLGVPKISRILGCINDGVAVLRLFHKFDFNSFAYLFLSSQTTVFRSVNQGMGQPNLNTGIIAGWPIPLPPLAEQKRIVAKVDELMALCDTLETKLRKASQVQEQLAISSIAALTGIHTQEKETMKAPKTELIARLKIGKKPSAKDQSPLAALLVRHQGELDSKVLWQHSGMERIDDFYHQLKFEMNQGWIVQPETPSVRVVGDR